MKKLVLVFTALILMQYGIKAQNDTTVKNPPQPPLPGVSMDSGTTIKAPVLLIVEVMPSFVGGEDALKKYIADHIKYPQLAKKRGISGTVVVQFVVETDGSISGITLLKDIGNGCGAEAVRVVKSMPKWNPGQQSGLPARVQYQLPVKFSLY